MDRIGKDCFMYKDWACALICVVAFRYTPFKYTILYITMATYPKIYYALVARERVILCDGGQMGFEQSSQAVLERLPQSVSMKSYAVSMHVYHIMVSDGLRYLCVADGIFDRQIAFGLLREMERQLISAGLKERAYYVGPYALRQEFGNRISPLLEQYSFDDKMSRLQDKRSKVKGIMTENIEKIVCRGENMEDLTDRATLLEHNATDFLPSRLHLRKESFCGSIKMWAIVIVTILVILLLIIVAVIVTTLKLTGHLQ